MPTQVNNQRIAKNTLLLYGRMLLIMAVSLYTSRVVLNTLGVEDYGIYNVVGGIVTMFAFLNRPMETSAQRYLTFGWRWGARITENQAQRAQLEAEKEMSIPIRSINTGPVYKPLDVIISTFLKTKVKILPEYKGTVSVFREVSENLSTLNLKHKILHTGKTLIQAAGFYLCFRACSIEGSVAG